MAWIPIAAAVAGAVANKAMESDSKSGGQPTYTMQTMPQWLQDKFSGAMQGMPGTANVMFGGQSYPSVYGPLMRSATNLYKPVDVIKNQEAGPNSLTGAMTASAPMAWMAANNRNMYDFNGNQSMGTYGMRGYDVPQYSSYNPYAGYLEGGGSYGAF